MHFSYKTVVFCAILMAFRLWWNHIIDKGERIMFEVLWQGRYYLLLGFWVAVLSIGTWLRFRVLSVGAARQAHAQNTRV
jgi:hypothetical protein